MIINAFGVRTDPGALNDWMNVTDQWDHSTGRYVLNLTAIDDYPNNSVVGYDHSDGDGLSNAKKPERPPNPNRQMPVTNLDSFLNDNSAVMVQVYNSNAKADRNGEHWVVVTGKINGEYTILDPGFNGRTLLSAYGNAIYKAHYFSHK